MTRRRLLLLLVVLLACAGGWYGWRRLAAPEPPVVALDGDDPELAEAIEAKRRIVGQSPYSAAAWGDLGMLLRGANLYEPAETCFARAAKLEPDEARWPYLRGESFRTREPDAGLPYLRRAAELWRRGEPHHVAPWLRLAELLQERGDLDEAEHCLRLALDADPGNPSVHLQLGLLFSGRDLSAARKHLLRAQHSPYTQKRACAQLAAVCLRQGAQKLSEDFAARAASLPADNDWIDPFVAECLLRAVGKTANLRRVEQLEARGDWQQAVELLREVIAKSPDSRASVSLGRDLLRLGDTDGAEEALREGLKNDREQVQGAYLLGQLALMRAKQAELKHEGEHAQEQYRQAIRQADIAISRKPDHALSHVLRGVALRAAGQRGEGLSALRRAVACGPDLVDTQLALGEALIEEGLLAEAKKHLEQAVLLAGTEDDRPRRALEKLKL